MQTFTSHVLAPFMAALALTMAGTAARADVVITFTQTANQVQAVLDGSLLTSAFTSATFRPTRPTNTTFNDVGLRLGPATVAQTIQYTASDPGAFSAFAAAGATRQGVFDAGTSMEFGTDPSVGMIFMWLPVAYTSGAALHAAGTWSGSFSSLGLITNTVVMPLLGNQKMTVNFVDATTAVPEPSSAALVGLGWVGLRRWRRKAKTPVAAIAIACAGLLPCAAHAAPVTRYALNIGMGTARDDMGNALGPATLTGSFVTDGTQGVLAASNILAWSFTLSITGVYSFTLDSASTAGSSTYVRGAVFSASASDVRLTSTSQNDFALLSVGAQDIAFGSSVTIPGNSVFQFTLPFSSPVMGDIFGTSVPYNTVFGTVERASVPEPDALALVLTAAGLAGWSRSRQNRKSASSCNVRYRTNVSAEA